MDARGSISAKRPPSQAVGDEPAVAWAINDSDFGGKHRQWSWAIIVTSAAMIVALWFLTYERSEYERNQAVEQVTRQNSNLAIALEEHTLRTFSSASQALAQVGRQRRAEGDRINIIRMVKEGAIDHSFLSVIGIADVHGIVLHDSLNSRLRGNFADRDFFKAHMDSDSGHIHIGKPLLGPLSGQWAIPISRRISNPDGSFGGVVFAGIRPDYFIEFYKKGSIGQDGLVQLLGLDGISRARLVGDQASFGVDGSKSSLFREQAKSPIGHFLTRGIREGVPRFESYRTLRDYPLIVAVGASQREALAEVSERKRLYFAASGVGTALIMSFAGLTLLGLARQREAALAVVESESRFRRMADTIEEGFWMAGPDRLSAFYVSPGVEAIWGRSCSELIENPLLWMNAIEPEDRPGVERALAELATGAPYDIEFRIWRPDGTMRWINDRGYAIRDGSGTVALTTGVASDVTERKQAELAVVELQTRLEAALTGGNVGLWDWNLVTNKVFYSEIWKSQLGYREDEIGDDRFVWEKLCHPDDLTAAYEAIKRCMADPSARYQVEFRMKHKRGDWRWMLSQGTIQRTEEGLPARFVGCHIDITERKLIEEQQRLFTKVIASIADGVVVTDPNKRIISVNQAFTHLTGYSPSEVLGQTPAILQSGRQDERFYREMWRQIETTGHWQGEIWNRRKSGEIYPELLSISAVRNGGGEITNYVGVFNDITSSKQYEERLNYLAYHDALTGLPNRTLFQQRLKETLGRARRHEQVVAVLYIDLDHFKNINDSLGHHVGDRLLQAVASRLTNNVREVDTVGRFGGDEFAVLLDVIDDNRDAATVARKLIEALARPFQIAEHQFYISASMGIGCYPQDGADVEELFKNADTAMYRAKAEGRNNYQYFSAEMNAKMLENLLMSNGLRRALERDEFMLHYQPRLDMATGQVTGVEALIRWRHPELGMVPPSQFIPLAEESGLIDPIGEWVLKTACRQMRDWLDAGLSLERLAVNLSARQFRHPDLLNRIAAVLAETGLPAHHLEIEVTESMVMHKPENTAVVLGQIKSMGIAISIDDFGTGYSSLSYLKRFPIDFLKIDQSFVRGVPDNSDDVAIVRAIIAMAKSLKLALIAEGVETADQRSFLREEGCEEAQGYLFSRPVPGSEVEAFLGRSDL